jgi:hypothetical protein
MTRTPTMMIYPALPPCRPRPLTQQQTSPVISSRTCTGQGKAWQEDLWFKIASQNYSLSPFPALAIIPDSTLVKNTLIQSMEDLALIASQYVFVMKHGEEILERLKRLDEEYYQGLKDAALA